MWLKTHTYIRAHTLHLGGHLAKVRVRSEQWMPTSNPLIIPPTPPAPPPLTPLYKKKKEKRLSCKADFTVFVVPSDLVVNSDPSKCSPLHVGCDLQAKIRGGRHLLGPLSALRHDRVRSLMGVVHLYSTEGSIIQCAIEKWPIYCWRFSICLLRALSCMWNTVSALCYYSFYRVWEIRGFEDYYWLLLTQQKWLMIFCMLNTLNLIILC